MISLEDLEKSIQQSLQLYPLLRKHEGLYREAISSVLGGFAEGVGENQATYREFIERWPIWIVGTVGSILFGLEEIEASFPKSTLSREMTALKTKLALEVFAGLEKGA